LAIIIISTKEKQISAKMPEHWRNRTVIESMPVAAALQIRASGIG